MKKEIKDSRCEEEKRIFSIDVKTSMMRSLAKNKNDQHYLDFSIPQYFDFCWYSK